jgi:hypothetical protein
LENRVDLKKLSPQTWQLCFEGHFREKIDPGTVVMCKLEKKSGEAIVFDGNLVEMRGKKNRKGYPGKVGILTITRNDKEILEKEMLR